MLVHTLRMRDGKVARHGDHVQVNELDQGKTHGATGSSRNNDSSGSTRGSQASAMQW